MYDLTMISVEVYELHGMHGMQGGRVRCVCGWSHGEIGGPKSWVLADVVRLAAEHPHPISKGGGVHGGGGAASGCAACAGYPPVPALPSGLGGGAHEHTCGSTRSRVCECNDDECGGDCARSRPADAEWWDAPSGADFFRPAGG